jgi:tetratricopeptide (TPR) repeat protein
LAKAYDYRPNDLSYALAYGELLVRQNSFKRAGAILESALKIARDLSQSNPDRYEATIAEALSSLGWVYAKTQRLEDAEDAFNDALTILRSFVKSNSKLKTAYAGILEHIRRHVAENFNADEEYAFAVETTNMMMGSTLINLGILYDSTGRPKQAEDTSQEAVRLFRDLAATDPRYQSFVGLILNNLGILYRETHRLKEAEEVLNECLLLDETLVKRNSSYEPELAVTLQNLSTIYGDMKRLGEEEEVANRALKIFRSMPQSSRAVYDHSLAGVLYNLALLYRDTRRPKEAQHAMQEARLLYRALAQADPIMRGPHLVDALDFLANIHMKAEQPQEAEAIYREELRIQRDMASKNSSEIYQPDVLELTLQAFTDFYLRTGRPKEADKAYEEELKIERELAKSNPKVYQPAIAYALNGMGLLYSEKEPQRAEEAYQEALQIRRSLSGTDPATYLQFVSNTLNNLGSLYRVTQQFGKAEKAYLEALQIRRQLATRSPRLYKPLVADTLKQLGLLYMGEMPAELYARVEKYSQEIDDENTENIPNMRVDPTILNQAQVVLQEALKLYRELAREDRARQRDVVEMLINLELIYSLGQQPQESDKAFQEALQLSKDNLDLDSEDAVELYVSVLAGRRSTHTSQRQIKEIRTDLDEEIRVLKNYRDRDPSTRFPESLPQKISELAATFQRSDDPKFLAIIEDAVNVLGVFWQSDPQKWSTEYAWALVLAGGTQYRRGQFDLACRDFAALEQVGNHSYVNAYGDRDFVQHFVQHCNEQALSPPTSPR